MNLMGAWVLASSIDCGMECCNPGEWSGASSFEASSCCQMNDVTCGFETGQYQELFDKAICCHNGIQKISATWDLVVSSSLLTPSPTLRFTPSERSTGHPRSEPLYLSNASLLC